ncbi:hypothetical protein ACVME8_005497 [Bradyrhizobium diazoefficiens]
MSRTRDRANRRTVTMPERVGPHVKLVFAEMARLRVTYDETEEGSGVRRASIKAWRRKNKPGLESLEAVLGSWGGISSRCLARRSCRRKSAQSFSPSPTSSA